MGQLTAFSYKQGNSFLHRCPALVKILLIPVVSIAVFKLPPAVAITLVIIQTVLSFALKFSLREQLCDLRAVLYYAVILLIIDFFTKADIVQTLLMLVKLLCVMQTASIVFKTSTTLQLRQALGKNIISETLALFICFIPQVSKNWAQIKKAWFARGGKKSLKMIIVLLPVLFSVGMKQAWNTARALSIRKGCALIYGHLLLSRLDTRSKTIL